MIYYNIYSKEATSNISKASNDQFMEIQIELMEITDGRDCEF